jgi:hypothetical protein
VIFRPWSSSSIFVRSWVTGTSFFFDPTYFLTSIPQQLPILEHAVAPAAPAASYKSQLRVLTLDRKVGPILGERYRLIATVIMLV